MAIAFDASSTKTDLTQPSSLTNSHTCTGSNRYLFVQVGLTAGTVGNVSGVTYNGVAMSSLNNVQPTGHGLRGTWWGLKNPASGANNIVATITGANDGVTMTGASYTGVDQTTPIGTVAAADSGAGTSAGASCTPSSALNDVVVGAVIIGNAATSITIGSGQTQRAAANLIVSNGEHDNRLDDEPGAAGTTTHDWTWTGATDWTIAAVALKPAAAATVSSGSSDYYSVAAPKQIGINSAQPHLLPYDSFTPRGNVPSPVVPYGKADYYDSRVQAAARAAYPSKWTFPYADFMTPRGLVPTAATPQGWTAYHDRTRAPRARPDLIKYDQTAERNPGVVTTPSGASAFYDIDKYPALKFRDQHESYPPRGLVPTAATPVGWTAFFDVDLPARSKAHLLPIDIDQTPDIPPPAAPQGWVSFYDVEVIKGKARDYIDVPSAPAQVVTAFIPTAFYDVNLNQLPPRRAAEASIYDVEPPEPALTAIDFTGFYDSRRLRPFLTQQHEAFQALGLVPTATTPQGFTASYDIGRVLGFPVKLQQHDAYQHFFPPTAVNLGPLGWSMFWDRGKRPLAPDRMPFEFEQRYQVPTATTPQGWTHTLDVARVKGFPAGLQQYDALQRTTVPPLVTVSFDAIAVSIIRPRAFPYSVLDIAAPVAAAPPMPWVSFPDLFKRPRAVPYLVWPEQRVPVFNTPTGAGGVSYYYDRRLTVAHRPPVETMPFDGRGLPFVVVNIIVHRPRESGLLTPIVLTATKAQPTLAGLKGNPALSGEVED